MIFVSPSLLKVDFWPFLAFCKCEKWPKMTIFERKMKEKLQNSVGNPRKSPQDTGADSLERFMAIVGSLNGFWTFLLWNHSYLLYRRSTRIPIRAKMSDFIVKMSKKSFGDPIMAVKRSRLSEPVSWAISGGFPSNFAVFPSFSFKNCHFVLFSTLLGIPKQA